MRKRSSTVKLFAVAAVVLAAVAGAVLWLWSVRLLPEQEKATGKAVRKEFRAASMDESAARLRKLVDERFFTVRFKGWLPKIGFEPKIPYDSIGLLAEEAMIKLTGDVKSPKADTDRRIKEMIGFAEYLIKTGKLSDAAANSLCERRLDGYFLVGDYDGAIAQLEAGMPERSQGWCKSTVAKLRAHKAMEANQRKEAIKHLQVFIDYMLSDEMENFEDSDPANGVVYSREWVAAKNYMRCASLAGDEGDAKGKADFINKAKPLYKTALEKAKEDSVSLDELKKEMKSYGL